MVVYRVPLGCQVMLQLEKFCELAHKATRSVLPGSSVPSGSSGVAGGAPP